MENGKKPFNFRQHALPKASRRYLWRVLIYFLLLSGVGYMAYRLAQPARKIQPIEGVQTIHTFSLEKNDTL